MKNIHLCLLSHRRQVNIPYTLKAAVDSPAVDRITVRYDEVTPGDHNALISLCSHQFPTVEFVKAVGSVGERYSVFQDTDCQYCISLDDDIYLNTGQYARALEVFQTGKYPVWGNTGNVLYGESLDQRPVNGNHAALFVVHAYYFDQRAVAKYYDLCNELEIDTHTLWNGEDILMSMCMLPESWAQVQTVGRVMMYKNGMSPDHATYILRAEDGGFKRTRVELSTRILKHFGITKQPEPDGMRGKRGWCEATVNGLWNHSNKKMIIPVESIFTNEEGQLETVGDVPPTPEPVQKTEPEPVEDDRGAEFLELVVPEPQPEILPDMEVLAELESVEEVVSTPHTVEATVAVSPGKMAIYIPSRSRSDHCWTLDMLRHATIKEQWTDNPIYLVVPYDQFEDYKPVAEQYGVELLQRPEEAVNLSQSRQFIGEHALEAGHKKMLQLDDDLRFTCRVQELSTNASGTRQFYKLRPLDSGLLYEGACIQHLLDKLENLLDDFAHASVSMRGINQNQLEPYRVNTRSCRALAYRTKEYNEFRMDETVSQQDFHHTIRMLRAGYPNICIFDWAQDQKETGTPGGCEDYRTSESHSNGIELLHSFHPEFTRIRQKENLSGHMRVRKEITVLWLKAFKSSKGTIPTFIYPTHLPNL